MKDDCKKCPQAEPVVAGGGMSGLPLTQDVDCAVIDRIRAALDILATFKQSDPSARFCKEIVLGKIDKVKKILEGNDQPKEDDHG